MSAFCHKCMSRAGRFLAWCPLLLACLAALAGPATAAGAAGVEVLEVDSYARTVEPGETATYNWTVYRSDGAPVNYTVFINVSGAREGWTASASPGSIPSLEPVSAWSVTVTVTAPSDPGLKRLNLTVTFTVMQDGAVVLYEQRFAVTSVHVEPPATEKKALGIWANPLPAPLDGDVGVFLLDILGWVAISACVLVFLDPVVKSFTRRTKTEVDDIVLKIVRTPVLLMLFTYGAVSSLKDLDRYLPYVVIDWANRIWGIVFWLAVLYVAYKLFKDLLVYYGRKIAAKTESKLDDVLVPIVEKVGVIVIAIAAGLYVLGYVGVDLTVFVAGGVVISMVIAFAAQETISNFFSGIFLTTDRPFVEKDIIILPDDDWYEVRKIGIRSTRLFRFKDASLVTIPNNKLANEKIANFTGVADQGRVTMTVGVAYGSDVEKVRSVIRGVIEKSDLIINDKPDLRPIVRFDKMKDSSLEFFILVWVQDRDKRFDVVDYLNTSIYNRFNEEGIEIPFPQRVVHLRQASGADPPARTAKDPPGGAAEGKDSA
ncbi:MAG: mechanosensitive ion channel [Euryarchaeota archaeon]|nr:mechanosensitive ion channel [Euryarchaeota archaeon]